MVSLPLLGLLALLGLFIQAFVAWVFVALFAAIGRRGGPPPAYRSFLWAFTALAVSLTIMSGRFLFARVDVGGNPDWSDGTWLVFLHYGPYMGLKAAFGLLLVAGSYRLGGTAPPRWLRPGGVAIVALAFAAPAVIPSIDGLLVIQAPLILGCALLAHRALAGAGPTGSGLWIVRVGLLALAGSWLLHPVAVFIDQFWSMRVVLSLNSYVDLAVQLTLGVGLMVSLVEDAHGRRAEAEQEREQLRRELERDEKLRALGTVVSGVAHELNNPLTAITGYADLRLEVSPDDEDIRIIAEQAERCRGIVRDLSALAGQSVSTREATDLEGLSQRVVRGLSSAHRSMGREVRIAPMGGLEVVIDAARIEQVLSNLVINALQASPEGGEVVVAATSRGSDVELTVTDQGPGVPAELRERLFEPFFTTKAPGQGTGLGLAIAHAIVRDHQGSLVVRDAPSGGASFCVLLPHAEASTPRAPVRASTPTRGGTLLVIDDDAAVRAVLARQAQRRGWEVAEAGTAEEALASDLSSLHAILCDLRMPGMGGEGFHDRLRAERPDLLERTVFLTGNLASADAVRFADRCSRPVLHKPVDYDELFANLSQA